MAHSNVVNSTRLEVLTRDNYDTWKIQAEALLIKNDSWGYVCGENPAPVVSGEGANLQMTQAAYKAWLIEDRKAKSDLILSIKPSELKQVRGCNTSKEVWEKLESVYASKGPARKATLLKKLTLHKMPEGGDVREHLSIFFDVVDKLQAMDIEINGELLSIMLLYSLPSTFENFRCAIESRDNLPDADSLRIKIIEENDARKQKTVEDEAGAMFARSQRPGAKTTKGGASGGRPNEGKQMAPSHTKYKCGYCKKIGHKAADCWKKKSVDQKASIASEAYFTAAIANESTQLSNNISANHGWCLDSGCTSHLCNDKNLFTNSEEVQSGLRLASNATTQVTAKGDVKIATSNGDQSKSITLENTLYVPDLRTNLLSVTKIVDRENEVTFRKDGAIVTDSHGRVKLIADREGDLFYLRKTHQACIATKDNRSSAHVWHERLGHLNCEDTSSMLKNLLQLKIEDKKSVRECRTCLIGKLTSLPFVSKMERSPNLLDIVHTDLCGPMRTTSIGGTRYFMTLIDDSSRWCEVYFLKSKDEAAGKFVEYKNLVETQTGRKIKAVQSDNGTEYCNKTMDEIFKKAGIRRRLTATHTPQQNGVAERKNRTLVESARCMMIHSGLPPSFWAEAVATANHIRNRCITKSLDGTTPYNAWTGRQTNIGYFKTFGCKAYVLDKAHNKGKFDRRGIEGIFVGYSNESKAYRVWIPEEKKIRVTRDVRFLDEFDPEDKFDDIISHETTNGRFQMVNDGITEIGGNQTDPEEEVQAQEILRETNASSGPPIISTRDCSLDTEDDVNEAVATKRGPGRPRKVKTGKPGRPTKQYNMVADERSRDMQPDGRTTVYESVQTSESQHDANVDVQSAEDDVEWHDAEIAMSASEINFSQAISGPDSEDWKDAIYSEIRCLVANDTWSIVEKPVNANIIGCRTVLRNKYKPDGSLERRKARIVARGFAQRPGIDFQDTFAPVARLESLRLLMALAVRFNMNVSQLDITTAYLNGKIDTEIYMGIPELLEEMLRRIVREEKDVQLVKKAKSMLDKLRGGPKVCKLVKALYGLRQAGRQWHAELNGTLQKIGLVPTNADPCVYVDKNGGTFILVYVDDIRIISNDRARERQIKEKLSESFDVKDLGEAEYCLGIEIHRDGDRLCISQSGYIRDILRKFGMDSCKAVNTPLAMGAKLTTVEKDDEEHQSQFPFRELMGALMYLAVGTRPDIAHAVSVLSQFNNRNGTPH